MKRPLGLTAVLAVVMLLAGRAPALRAQDEDGVAIGSRAPRVTIGGLDGTAVDLGRFIGSRPVLLEFWATWCEQCAALMPRVRAARAAFGTKVEFVGVNVAVNQTPERVRRYVAQERPPFLVLYDAKGAGAAAYHVPATSYVVIVDRAGKVAYTGSGADQDLEQALRRVTAP